VIDQRLFEMATSLTASAFRVISVCGNMDAQSCSLDVVDWFQVWRANARRAYRAQGQRCGLLRPNVMADDAVLAHETAQIFMALQAAYF
jgi:hypothetical protein